jgi:hypothetical protein
MEAFTMKTIFKFAVAAGLAGALALTAVTPSQARHWHGRGAAIGGFAAGALIGAAVAGSAYNNGYYGPGYGYAPGYYAEPGYAYDDSYAYEPSPVYVEPAPQYYYGGPRHRSGDNCTASPASGNFGACN